MKYSTACYWQDMEPTLRLFTFLHVYCTFIEVRSYKIINLLCSCCTPFMFDAFYFRTKSILTSCVSSNSLKEKGNNRHVKNETNEIKVANPVILIKLFPHSHLQPFLSSSIPVLIFFLICKFRFLFSYKFCCIVTYGRRKHFINGCMYMDIL